jgi:hypothetical protein
MAHRKAFSHESAASRLLLTIRGYRDAGLGFVLEQETILHAQVKIGGWRNRRPASGDRNGPHGLDRSRPYTLQLPYNHHEAEQSSSDRLSSDETGTPGLGLPQRLWSALSVSAPWVRVLLRRVVVSSSVVGLWTRMGFWLGMGSRDQPLYRLLRIGSPPPFRISLF